MADLDIESEVVGIFRPLAKASVGPGEDLLAAEYLDRGLIDSLDLVRLIVAIETKFDVSFQAEEIESARFRTLRGVCTLVREKRGERP